MQKEEILERIDRLHLVAVIRTKTAEQGLKTARALTEAGIRLLEITFTIPGALEVISELRKDLKGEVTLGAGSVLEAEQARRAIQAGAQFLVSPLLQPDLVPPCQEAGVVVVMGGLSPTEILAARRAGADLVKVFPVDAVGGPRYIQGLLAPLPNLPLLVSGGVTFENFLEYLKVGVRAVALGSDLMPTRLIEGGAYHALTEHARRFVEALNRAKLPSASHQRG